MHLRRSRNLALLAVVTVLIGCGRPPAPVDLTVTHRAAPLMASTGPAATTPSPIRAATVALFQRSADEQRWRDTVTWNEVAARPAPTPPAARRAVPSLSPSFDPVSVMQCIKDHESGNYAESSHPGSGSGAYQYVPSTWAEWSVRAGYGARDDRGNPLPTYQYAYQAPPNVQDDVTVFVLANGGAGNWSPRYGDDPCTVGFGG